MHRPVISRAAATAASALALGLPSCGTCDDCNGPGVLTARGDLIALARTDTNAPPPPVTTVPVKNSQIRTIVITHTDSTGTAFLELAFPVRSMVQVGSQLVCDTCTVNVSVTPTAGVYGFTLGPANLVFRASSTPTVTMRYATYADFTVRDSSTLYPTEQAFDQALELWFETSAGFWRRSRNSAHTGSRTVTGAIDQPGAHLLAAPK
jgi:hypothetical protein